MAEYLIQSETLDDIADAINAKTGGSSAMTPAEMVTEIQSIETGQEVYVSARGVPYAKELVLPQFLIISGNAVQLFSGCSNLEKVICNDSRLVGGSASNNISNYFSGCTNLKEARFPLLQGINNSYCDTVFGGCSSLEIAVFGSIDHPISKFNNSSYNQRPFTGLTQSTLTIILYVNAATLADIPSDITQHAPWGAVNATIVYRNSTTGEVINA